MNSNETLSLWTPHVLSTLRIVAARLFLEHGTQKLLGFPASEFSPDALSLLWIAGLFELVGGVLLCSRSVYPAGGVCAFRADGGRLLDGACTAKLLSRSQRR